VVRFFIGRRRQESNGQERSLPAGWGSADECEQAQHSALPRASPGSSSGKMAKSRRIARLLPALLTQSNSLLMHNTSNPVTEAGMEWPKEI